MWKLHKSNSVFAAKFFVNVSLTTTDSLHTLYLPITPHTSLTMMPTAPTTECWMATRSCNATAHPSAVDISMEEETADNIPKTPAPKKRKARYKKNIKSAEEIEAGIQRVAAYERQSLKEELIHTTPQVVYTPAPPHDPSEPHESSERDKGASGKWHFFLGGLSYLFTLKEFLTRISKIRRLTCLEIFEL